MKVAPHRNFYKYVPICIHSMVTKNIALTEEAYEVLKRHKRSGESFSKIVIAHFKKKHHLLDYAGFWEGIPQTTWEALKLGAEEARKGLSRSIRKKTTELV